MGNPFGDPALLADTLRATSLSPADKLRLVRLAAYSTVLPELWPISAHELLQGPETTTRAFLRDFGFSERAITAFFEPFFGGIFLDRELATSSRLFSYYFRMLLQGAIAIPSAGMGTIPAQLAAGLDIGYGCRVTALDAGDAGVTVHGPWGELRADAVVVATDPRECVRLCGMDLPTAAVGATYLHYRSVEPIDREKRILLAGPGGPINNAVWTSNVAPEYAPPGMSVLNTTVLGPQFDASDEDLDTAVRLQLGTWYGTAAAEVLELLAIDRIPFAQFAQPPGVLDDLPAPVGRLPNVVVASEATRFSSIQGAMEAGEQAAAVLLGNERGLARPRGA